MAHGWNYFQSCLTTAIIFFAGTSNWTKDYFLQTAGLGFIFQSAGKAPSGKSKRKDVREKLVHVFNRDWESQWAKILTMTNL
jgi:phospholipase D3/4